MNVHSDFLPIIKIIFSKLSIMYNKIFIKDITISFKKSFSEINRQNLIRDSNSFQSSNFKQFFSFQLY